MGDARIFLSPPDVGQEEIARVRYAMNSGWVAPLGPEVDAFEEGLSTLAGREQAVALSSGTAALHLGLLALGVEPGDLVICSSLTFVATANAISYVGAEPVFVDSEPATGNLSVPLLSEAIEDSISSGRKVGAVIPVDFLGSVANYEELLPTCAKFGIPVLADSAESVGATRFGRPAGSFGDASIFSFNGNKIMTTSGGGAFLTNSAQQAELVRHLSSQAREKSRHYQHERIGFNYRLSNILAAIGNAQLGRLDEMLLSRREIRRRYRELWRGVSGVSVLGDSDAEDNCWLTAIVIEPGSSAFSSRSLADFLESREIESRPLWKPMHMQPLYRKAKAYLNGTAESLFANGLALPSGSGMTEGQWERIVGAFKDFTRGGE